MGYNSGITTMGGRAGGGGGRGMGGAYSGFRSGIGSDKGYGLNNDQRLVFEALKSDAKYNGNVVQFSSGGVGFEVGGKTYDESGLAKAVKTGWSEAKQLYGLSGKQLADKRIKYLVNHKTGTFFGDK